MNILVRALKEASAKVRAVQSDISIPPETRSGGIRVAKFSVAPEQTHGAGGGGVKLKHMLNRTDPPSEKPTTQQ
jgi:hypothetical protein